MTQQQEKHEHCATGEMGSIVDVGMPTSPGSGGAFDEHHPPDAALIGEAR